MSNLIIRRGYTKTAAAEDGPTFEQQFGILANAKIVEKFPKLDTMKLAFQLIDKDDDNNKAVGAVIYLVGGTVIFVPAFYRNEDTETGDMMFLAQTQQFLPLSDPWLAWVQNKELQQPGELVPETLMSETSDGQATTIKDSTDPIIKTATLYLKGVMRKAKDLASSSDFDLFDTVIGMGKTASESMLDNLIGNKDFLNAALRFYSADHLDGFAKKAVELGKMRETVKVILPFTKEAKELSPEDTAILNRDGYIIKQAASEHLPTVIRSRHVRDTFKTVSTPGKRELLMMNGETHPCLVLQYKKLSFRCGDEDPEDTYRRAIRTQGDPGVSADYYMHGGHGDEALCAIASTDAKGVIPLRSSTLMLATGENKDFNADMLSSYGVAAAPAEGRDITWNTVVLCPDGTAYELDIGRMYPRSDSWMGTDDRVIVVSKDDRQKAPIASAMAIILPKGSRLLVETSPDTPTTIDDDVKQELKGKHSFPYVTWDCYETFLTNYTSKNFKKVKVTTNGSEMYIDDDTSDGKPMSIKEASLYMVKTHGVEPGVVRNMFKELGAGSGTRNAKSDTYLISKIAVYDDQSGWQEANMPKHDFQNIGDQREYVQMPTVLENPEQLQKAVVMAAENGIKDVFDVTAFKLLIKQNRFLEDISKDIPLFMRVLDSLCQKLFLLYCHTDEFENQYGTVKLKSIEESLKNTIDSLSELTVFFKLRAVDTSAGIGQDGGNLMRGYDM